MQYIYSRVSTVEQNATQQTELLKDKYKHNGVFEDQFSGKDFDRPAMNEMLAALTVGDSVVFYDISRIGRNTVDVISFCDDMTSKGVQVIIHTLGGVDITSSTGKMVLTTLAAVAEMQRTEMLEKQRIGIERAKVEKKYKGKQVSQETIDKFTKITSLIDNNGLSVTDALKTVNLSRAQYYRMKKAD